jgi:hypothetical protein
MNPVQYTISNARPGYEGKTWPFYGEYFEVDTPTLKMRYSEVFWNSLEPVALPADVIARYANRTIAFTGFEVNVFRRDNITGKEFPVPAYQSYNHHYSPNIFSSYVKLMLDHYGKPMGHDSGHGKILQFKLREDLPAPPPDARLNQAFVHGNGQEHRQLYHGAPAGYVQTIYSPGWFVLSPMQISTNDGTGRIGAAAPLPRFSREYAPADAPYSPLLECPCTTRIVFNLVGSVLTLLEGQCPLALAQDTCFTEASKTLGYEMINSNDTISNPNLPYGCLVSLVSAGHNTYNVAFNTLKTLTPCQGNGKPDPSKYRLLGSQVDLVDMSLDIDGANDLVTISLSGPSQYWYGVGFDASKMADLPYAIIVDGNGQVQERILANHDPGHELQPSVKILSNTVTNGVRTIVLQRTLVGITPDHYNFTTSISTIPFINALGDTVDLSQHKSRSASAILLFHDNAIPTCLCGDGVKTIAGIPYEGDCKPEPLSDLLRDNNPTCQADSYVGGLACCLGGQFLLDADQTPPPFVDEVYFKFRFYYEDHNPARHQDIYHVEWSQNGCDSGAGGPNPMGCKHIEYDIVKGTSSAMGKNTQMFTSTFPAGGMLEEKCEPIDGQCMDGSKVGPKGFKLMMAAAHCHAPNCIRQELRNVDTGEVLCVGVPVHGQSEDVFDEAGYLYIPPCIWGTVEEGLFPPPIFQKNTTLQMITFYNSTYGHPGQMGIWQMKAAYVL